MSANEQNTLIASDINEDTVLVKVFSSTSNVDCEFWENLTVQINSVLKTLTHDYIWHRDELKLCLPINYNDTDASPTFLTSTVCFGDNIEDEWFIVYLLMEISKLFENIIIQIMDNDGGFLLIEAANYLPSWAKPENTENRVFIMNNAIHIIPPNLADLKRNVKLEEALQILVNYPEQTKVCKKIQEAILTRVGQYPDKMLENFHRAIVKLPLDIAALLTLQPSLIAPIVTTYSNHDVIDVKSCRNLNYSDYLTIEVKFTKCLYAMLMHSKPLKNMKTAISSDNQKRDILGNKLTCGFQMIMNTLNKDIFCTKEYIKFENNLKDNGYFRGNIKDSLEYNRLLKQAKEYFRDIECPINSYVSNKISELFATDDFLQWKESLKHQRNCEDNLNEDNDDWLSINPIQLNDLLNNRYGNQVKFNADDVTSPELITSKLTDFLKQSSDFEGIDTNKNDDNDCINFEPDQFVNCLEKMIDMFSSDINEINLGEDSDIECESDISDEINNDSELDKELAEKLKSFKERRSDNKRVMFNLSQSIKEEGVTGPSSNLLSSIGVHKTDLLDSDDD